MLLYTEQSNTGEGVQQNVPATLGFSVLVSSVCNIDICDFPSPLPYRPATVIRDAQETPSWPVHCVPDVCLCDGHEGLSDSSYRLEQALLGETPSIFILLL